MSKLKTPREIASEIHLEYLPNLPDCEDGEGCSAIRDLTVKLRAYGESVREECAKMAESINVIHGEEPHATYFAPSLDGKEIAVAIRALNLEPKEEGENKL